MKRILINATHNEEVRVALCKGNHLYDFDLENRTREQKKSNIYKGHVTRVEPSLEAVFVEYGSKRQGFLPIREIASNYLAGNPREENIRKLIKEGDELIVQVEKEERGNKGAALSTYVSLAGRYLVLMPNNPRGGGISRQISGKLREDMKRMLGNLDLPKGMSVIVRTAGIGKTQDDLQHDLNHLLNIWNAIQEQNEKYPSPRLVHQESGVVTRAVRDYLRDDISEIWIDNEDAFVEAETFVKAVMPTQLEKLRKYTDFEPMFSNFGVERQIETAYQREVRLPSGGSIVIDQTEALVSIDINSAKSTKGADVSETAYHTNLEAADEIARQLRLRDMGGLIVIDFIDMNDSKHQKDVEKRLVEATKYDRARVQFGEISRFGLMEMSRQRLRPSLEESTGYICPRCHGNGMIRDLRSLSLSIMRQIEQTALKERHGEVQAEVPTDIAAFLLNEKRESLVYLEQDSGTRITILPHAHLESPNFNLHFNHQGFAPSSYERVTDTHQQESSELGYEVDWQTSDAERPEQQPTRQPRQANASKPNDTKSLATKSANVATVATPARQAPQSQPANAQVSQSKPAAVAWLSNLFAPTPQAEKATAVSSADAAQAIEAIVNTGAQSRGMFGDVSAPATTVDNTQTDADAKQPVQSKPQSNQDNDNDRRRSRNNRSRNKYDKKNDRSKSDNRSDNRSDSSRSDSKQKDDTHTSSHRSQESSNRSDTSHSKSDQRSDKSAQDLPRRDANSKRESRGAIERGTAKTPQDTGSSSQDNSKTTRHESTSKSYDNKTSGKSLERDNRQNQNVDPNEVNIRVTEAKPTHKENEVVHISLDNNQGDDKAVSTTSTVDTSSQTSAKATPQTKDNASVDSSDINKPQPSKADSATKQDVTAKDAVQEDAPKEDAIKESTVPAKSQTTEVEAAKSEPTQEAVASEPSAIEANSKSEEVAKLSETEDSKVNSDEGADKTLSFDTEALFADRYVVAKKYGQAQNDPRVVKASLKKGSANKESTSEQEAPQAVSHTSVSKISGTVGEFIHNHLAQAAMRLAKDGVVTCFLSALNAHNETSGGQSSKSQSKPSKSQLPVMTDKPESEQSFSFVNYGYDSLSPSYLQQFAEMTSSVAAYHIGQGKTVVTPTAITKRASNDPRGQHPDYVEQYQEEDNKPRPDAEQVKAEQINDGSNDTGDNDNVSNASEHTNVVNNNDAGKTESHVKGESVHVDTKATEQEQSPAQAMGELLKLNVGHFIERVLGQEGRDIIDSGQTEVAFLKALRQPLNVLLSVAKSVNTAIDNSDADDHSDDNDKPSADGADQPAEALTKAPIADITTQKSADILESSKEDKSMGDSSDDSDINTGTDANAADTDAKDSETDADIKSTDSSDKGSADKGDTDKDRTDKDSVESKSTHASNKTSIETYKSMIETISEQLLPQTGLLNLSSTKVPSAKLPSTKLPSTKVPKSRSRKTKDEPKNVPSQETDGGDSNHEDDHK